MVWIQRLAFFLLIFYISCTSEIQNNGNVFVVATYDDVTDWDPATAYSLEVLPMSNIYEPLLWLDASDNDHKIIPGLATAYTKSKDGLVWKFALRKNVYFHDGQYFNADAVKYVIDRNNI